MADHCDPIRNQLRDLEAELQHTEKFANVIPGEQHPPKPKLTAEWIALVDRIAKTRSALQACAESLLIRRWTVTGQPFVGSLEIEAIAKKFMKAHAIRAMSIAVAREGTLIANQAYTWAEQSYPVTQPTTLFRMASVSKIFTCAAIDRLVATGKLSFTTQAFGFLGISSKLLTTQTHDPDIDTITVLQLATRKSGLQRDFGADFRLIASRLGQSAMPTRAQLVEYVYGEPLFARPGSMDYYSNSAFAVLTSIVEKASGRSFIDYLRDDVLPPLDIHDLQLGATAANLRKPNEVSSYDDAGFGPSQTDMTVDAVAPNAYGGQFALENGEGEGGLITSTGTVARFLGTHAVWNIGRRETGARYGDLAGTGAAAVSRFDGLDFAYALNHLIDDTDHDALVKQINAVLDRHLVVKSPNVFASVSAFIVKLLDYIRRVVALRLNP